MLDKAFKLTRDAFSGLLDLVYPPHCLVCGEAGDDYLCAKCIEQIDVIEPPYCRKCGLPSESFNCSDCRDREFAFEYARSAGTFDGVLRKAIHALKFGKHIVMADPLADLLVRCFPETNLRGKVDLVVPVPIHSSRVLERGFNQSEELARAFCRRVSLPLETAVLRKTKKTRHQVDLPLDERAINIKGSFSVIDTHRIAGKRVLLMDDVFTTGATLDEAAQVLLNAGALRVYAYTLARSL